MEPFFEVSAPARRRARIRAELPTVVPPAVAGALVGIAQLPDPEHLCAEERAAVMSAVATARNRLEAYLCAVAGAADAHGDSTVLHAGTTGMLVAAATGSTPAVGSSMVKTARGLRDLPQVAGAWRAGRISGWHVHAIVSHAGQITDFGALEPAVVGLASVTDARELGHILQVRADNDSDEDDGVLSYRAQRARRCVRLSARRNGMWRLTGLLDDATGASLADALAAATAGAEIGGDTVQARRADALMDLVDAGVTNTRPLGVSQVSVLIDVADLPDGAGATLPDGTPITADVFDLVSCAAACVFVFGVRRGDTFVPLALGRGKRRASAAQWAALIARDRGCIRCGRTPRYCHAHHIVHWKNGGLTDLQNLVLLCSRCHHDLHHGRYTITMTPEGVPDITPNRRAPPRE
jgi:hypothetical protein